ncbi:MAG TPA: glycosyltransferase family 9 protein [bacterium]|nr:glycosyltransferase family 9 protein [bacterium]
MTRPPRHILVSRTDKIGDLLLSLPVFQTLRAAFPKAKITALVSPYAKEIVQGHPAVDSVELLHPGEGFLSLQSRFRKLAPDVFLALYPRPAVALAAWAARVPLRVGTAFRWYGFTFNEKIRAHRSACERHEADYNLDLARVLGVERTADRILVPVPAADQAFADDLLKEKGVPKAARFVAVHPGHKGSALNWSPRRYAEVVTRLLVGGRRVVLTAGPDETALMARVADFLGPEAKRRKPVMLIGECGLKQLAGVYRRADVFLSGSTGTMHLAAAVGTPTVALFCPIPATTPVRWGPWGNRATVLMPEGLTCPDCQRGFCRRHDPMDGIPVERVLEALKPYLGRPRA